MALSRVETTEPGYVKVHDDETDDSTTGRVNDDGQVDIKFHSNPKQLAIWFERFHDAFQDCPIKKQPMRHKPKEDETLPGSPRLNIAIHIVGSRGDVQPFIPIAKLLSSPPHNHRVRICTHSVFQQFVESNGVEFFNIGGDPEALMAYMVKNPGLMPSRESLRAGDVGKRMKEMAEIMDGLWRSCIEAGNGKGEKLTAMHVPSAKDLFIADIIIANPPSTAHIHCAEKLNIPLHMVFTMPWSPTRKFHHPLAAMSYNEADPSVANYLSFMMMELLTWEGLGDIINVFRTKTLRLQPISPLWGYRLLPRLRVPYTYLWSQSLIAKPSDWDEHINITGFSFLSLANSYTAPQDLAEFLEKGPPPVYIGFGSIVVDDPQALTLLILEAVRIAGIRAILSKGWGGVGDGEVPENVYLIGNCPHDWLFQRVSAVVHHGGAGTTAAGIAAGRPTVVVPFFGDQPFWGQMIAQVGAGPVPVPFKKMTAETLATSITFALKPEVQTAVQEMAHQISQEDGSGDAAQDINARIGIDNFRCDLLPNQLATWYHQKTGMQLCGFAAACLVLNGLIRREHMRLLRRNHWYIEEGAEHPLFGAIASVTGFFREVGVATNIYQERLRSQPASKPQELNVILGESVDTETEELFAESNRLTPTEVRDLAWRMAKKSLHREYSNRLRSRTTSGVKVNNRSDTVHSQKPKSKPRLRLSEVMRASGQYAASVTKAGLKTPVSFFYNIANGYHNLPSYGFWGTDVRRRDEVTGLVSGLQTAGKEFVLGFYDAFSGIALQPYRGAKDEKLKGLGKGIFRAFRGFVCNISSAAFGLPGFTLKGIEMEISKNRLTELSAELYLIRLRQSIDAYQNASEAERQDVLMRWRNLH